MNHYQIELSIQDAPPDAYAVTYHLDDSYYDPIREARRARGGFPEDITSYGDYTVRAEVRTRGRTIALAKRLSDALARGHRENHGAAVGSALADIRDN